MTLEELKKVVQKHSRKYQKLIWQKSGYFYSPFISKFATVDKHEFNSSYYNVYTLTSDPSVYFTMVLSFYDGEYILKCGDAFADGTLSENSMKDLTKNSLIKIKKSKNQNEKLTDFFTQSYKSLPKSRSCVFNQKNYQIAGEVEVCEHIANFLNDLPNDVYDKLYNNYYASLDNSEGYSISPTLKVKFDRYAFKKHILLEGDKGSGKTYAATSWGKDKNYTQIFIGGHEQFESIDFLGHYIQQKNGDLIWKDGALSEAFRKADTGESTVLIIDEILRIPKRELNLLISALSSIEGKYVLRTGRAMNVLNDIAIEEVIEAPVNKLWVIGTTNIGASYAVEAMDEALSDRFKPIRKDTSEDELRTILMKTATKKQFSYAHVNKLMDFYTKMNRLYKTKIINKIVNIRHLNEALELARREDEIKDILLDSQLLWVERDYDGHPNIEQLDAINQVMRKHYD